MKTDWLTVLFFIGLYVWGFSLTIWAIFFDKQPSKLSVKASKFALAALLASLGWFLYQISVK